MEEPQLDVPNESHFNVHQQSPSSSLLLSPLPDDWVEEIIVDVPDETPLNSAPDRVMNATENSNVAGRDIEAVVPGPPSRPLQVFCDDGRLRRQMPANIQQHLIVINPTNETRSNATMTQTENEFATCINDQRRLCDCLSCVSHALRLATRIYATEMPSMPGVRFLTLPGLSLQPATKEQVLQLVQFFDKHPEQSLVACGCVTCARHRNLAKAWRQALSIQNDTTAARRHCYNSLARRRNARRDLHRQPALRLRL